MKKKKINKFQFTKELKRDHRVLDYSDPRCETTTKFELIGSYTNTSQDIDIALLERFMNQNLETIVLIDGKTRKVVSNREGPNGLYLVLNRHCLFELSKDKSFDEIGLGDLKHHLVLPWTLDMELPIKFAYEEDDKLKLFGVVIS